jgi:hypothetical protein
MFCALKRVKAGQLTVKKDCKTSTTLQVVAFFLSIPQPSLSLSPSSCATRRTPSTAQKARFSRSGPWSPGFSPFSPISFAASRARNLYSALNSVSHRARPRRNLTYSPVCSVLFFQLPAPHYARRFSLRRCRRYPPWL